MRSMRCARREKDCCMIDAAGGRRTGGAIPSAILEIMVTAVCSYVKMTVDILTVGKGRGI